MSNNQPEAKYKPGDYVYYNNNRYLIEEVVKIDRGWVYNISTGNSVTNVDVKKGDDYFRKA